MSRASSRFKTSVFLNTDRRTKDKPRTARKILADYRFNEGLLTRKCKEHSKVSNNTNNPPKK